MTNPYERKSTPLRRGGCSRRPAPPQPPTSRRIRTQPRNLVPLVHEGDAEGRGSAVEPTSKQKPPGEFALMLVNGRRGGVMTRPLAEPFRNHLTFQESAPTHQVCTSRSARHP